LGALPLFYGFEKPQTPMLSQLRCRFARAVQMATRGEGQRNGDGGEWWPGFVMENTVGNNGEW
jgi:hypothetical protein